MIDVRNWVMSDISNPPKIPHKPTTPESEAIGRVIRAGRRAADLTMGDIARKLGCQVSRVSEIELGQETPTVDELNTIAKAIWPWQGA